MLVSQCDDNVRMSMRRPNGPEACALTSFYLLPLANARQ